MLATSPLSLSLFSGGGLLCALPIIPPGRNLARLHSPGLDGYDK